MIKLNLNKSSAASSGRLCALKRAAALITAATLTLALLFTGCPNSAGGSGGGTTPPTGKTYTVGSVQFTMKDIAAVTNGTVGHADESDNKPHTVSLTAYRIGETEVTQELWQAVMGNNPSNFSGSLEGGEVQGKRPVENVNWYQCIAFCNKLSKACNLDPCYTVTGVDFDALNFSDIPTSDDSDWNNAVCDRTKKGFRLPTEAEWEWCWDRYGSFSYPLPLDYAGAASGDARVVRGGSWFSGAGVAARASRSGFNPGSRDNDVGLRLVSRP